MGLLVEGTWQDRWYNTKKTGGRFVRKATSFHNTIEAGGDHPPEAGRYHLFVARACPWAHRTMLFRELKGLTDVIGYTLVHPDMLDEGWVFKDDHPDDLLGLSRLYELYLRHDPTYTGRVTVPVLWDKQTERIVNNESSEIIRFFNTAFDEIADASAPFAGFDLYPEDLRDAIDAVNATVYDNINNGVYRSGFATTQEAYEDAVNALFATMDDLEARLASQPWLTGDRITEADLRLFPTLLRFDPVYYAHFKCSRRRLVEYPNLWDHTRAIYQIPGVTHTIDMASIRRHYFYSHESVNPHRIVPVMPDLDFDAPAERTAALPF